MSYDPGGKNSVFAAYVLRKVADKFMWIHLLLKEGRLKHGVEELSLRFTF